MSVLSKEYFRNVIKLIEKIIDEEENSINQAAQIMVDAIEKKHRIFGFGCYHYSLHIQDMIYRAGGLVNINPIFIPGLDSLNNNPLTSTSRISQLKGYGEIIIDNYSISDGDIIIIVSGSGSKVIEIEMAKIAKRKGSKIISIFSNKASQNILQSHPKGENLKNIADVVLDNKVEIGDAIMETPEVKEKFSSVSGILNITLLHALITACVEGMVDRGLEPPILVSGNLPGGKKHNEDLLKYYEDQIIYK